MPSPNEDDGPFEASEVPNQDGNAHDAEARVDAIDEHNQEDPEAHVDAIDEHNQEDPQLQPPQPPVGDIRHPDLLALAAVLGTERGIQVHEARQAAQDQPDNVGVDHPHQLPAPDDESDDLVGPDLPANMPGQAGQAGQDAPLPTLLPEGEDAGLDDPPQVPSPLNDLDDLFGPDLPANMPGQDGQAAQDAPLPAVFPNVENFGLDDPGQLPAPNDDLQAMFGDALPLGGFGDPQHDLPEGIGGELPNLFELMFGNRPAGTDPDDSCIVMAVREASSGGAIAAPASSGAAAVLLPPTMTTPLQVQPSDVATVDANLLASALELNPEHDPSPWRLSETDSRASNRLRLLLVLLFSELEELLDILQAYENEMAAATGFGEFLSRFVTVVAGPEAQYKTWKAEFASRLRSVYVTAEDNERIMELIQRCRKQHRDRKSARSSRSRGGCRPDGPTKRKHSDDDDDDATVSDAASSSATDDGKPSTNDQGSASASSKPWPGKDTSASIQPSDISNDGMVVLYLHIAQGFHSTTSRRLLRNLMEVLKDSWHQMSDCEAFWDLIGSMKINVLSLEGGNYASWRKQLDKTCASNNISKRFGDLISALRKKVRDKSCAKRRRASSGAKRNNGPGK